MSETGRGSAGRRGTWWRPWWWTSGRRALGRRGVEAAPKVEGTSGLGGSGTPALLGIVFLSGISLK